MTTKSISINFFFCLAKFDVSFMGRGQFIKFFSKNIHADSKEYIFFVYLLFHFKSESSENINQYTSKKNMAFLSQMYAYLKFEILENVGLHVSAKSSSCQNSGGEAKKFSFIVH